jgi:hypothetical protein
MNSAPTPLNLWTERYETLRRHFVDNRQCLASDPLGLTLLLGNGMAGWMRAWRSCAEAAPKADAPTPDSWCSPISTGWQQELTLLVAHMTVQHLSTTAKL